MLNQKSSRLFFIRKNYNTSSAILFFIVSVLSRPCLAMQENANNMGADNLISHALAIDNIDNDLNESDEDSIQDKPVTTDALNINEYRVQNKASHGSDIELTHEMSSIDLDTSPPSLTEIEIVTGANLLVPIAVAHLNRIETPFSAPKVRTNSDATIEVEDNVLYILTYDTHPISLFIEETDFPDNRVSLTLIAKKIPPIDIRLTTGSDYLSNVYIDNSPARLKPSKSITEIKEIFKALATHKLPTGFTQYKMNTSMLAPICNQGSLAFNFDDGHLLKGDDKQIFVGKVTNHGLLDIELNEENCLIDNLIAISFFPLTRLSPAQTTQIYLMTSY